MSVAPVHRCTVVMMIDNYGGRVIGTAAAPAIDAGIRPIDFKETVEKCLERKSVVVV
ncbi:hypothetical protein [Bifidobacterium goeldii]|uniref:hypothetical protein n=1 Tax=Bifidobacterium goeldii TaxID=2306975 RepID=UPI0013DE59FD|nr:hypothetical protein [Bifidobacterium goeldii]